MPAIPWRPRSYAAPRAATPPAIDGVLDEASWQAAPWTDDFTDIEGPARPAPRHRTRAKLLWDDRYLYVGAQLEEPDLWGTLVEHDSVIYHDDDFEVFIDPDGDTHEYYELEINPLGTVWDLFLVRPYRDGGPAINAWEIQGLKSAVSLDGTLNRPGDRDRGWSVELALPWSVLKEAAHRDAPPAPGDRWRVNFSRVEWRVEVEGDRYRKVLDPATGKALPEDNWVWSPQGLIAMHYPEMWGFVEFSPLAAGAAAGPAGGTAGGGAAAPDEVAKWLLRVVYYGERNWFAAHGAYTADLAALGLSKAPYPPADGAAGTAAGAAGSDLVTDKPAGGSAGAPTGPATNGAAGAPVPWPPALAVTPTGFEASLGLPGGRRITIRQDGAVR